MARITMSDMLLPTACYDYHKTGCRKPFSEHNVIFMLAIIINYSDTFIVISKRHSAY